MTTKSQPQERTHQTILAAARLVRERGIIGVRQQNE